MRALAALAIVVAGSIAAFAVYTFGWRDDGEDRNPQTAPSGRHVYTLRQGDVIRVPAAATECEASGEAGKPNLFCVRTPRGRHQIILYEDSVLVWPLARGPDGPPFIYHWKP